MYITDLRRTPGVYTVTVRITGTDAKASVEVKVLEREPDPEPEPEPEPDPEPEGVIRGYLSEADHGRRLVITAVGEGTYGVETTGGSFALTDLPHGTYTVFATVDGVSLPPVTIKIGDGSPTEAQLTICLPHTDPEPDPEPELPPTGSPGWPYYLGGALLLVLGGRLIRRRREAGVCGD